jgi:glycerol-3-phosphate acyltransferase PlsY
MNIIFAVFSYLLGSFPTGYVFVFLSEKKDIRKYGSRATGATNVLRMKGWVMALLVVLIDVLKGALPVYLAMMFFADRPFAALCGFLAVLGHCFPVFLKFKGGKGVATAAGAFLFLALKPMGLSLVVFILIVVISRFVSLASLSASLSLPLFIYLLQGNREVIAMSIAVFIFLALTHRSNIIRLIKGEERKLGEKVG